LVQGAGLCRSPPAMGVALSGEQIRSWTQAALASGMASAAARAVGNTCAVGGVGTWRRRGGRAAARRARCRCGVHMGVAVAWRRQGWRGHRWCGACAACRRRRQGAGCQWEGTGEMLAAGGGGNMLDVMREGKRCLPPGAKGYWASRAKAVPSSFSVAETPVVAAVGWAPACRAPAVAGQTAASLAAAPAASPPPRLTSPR